MPATFTAVLIWQGINIFTILTVSTSLRENHRPLSDKFWYILSTSVPLRLKLKVVLGRYPCKFWRYSKLVCVFGNQKAEVFNSLADKVWRYSQFERLFRCRVLLSPLVRPHTLTAVLRAPVSKFWPFVSTIPTSKCYYSPKRCPWYMCDVSTLLIASPLWLTTSRLLWNTVRSLFRRTLNVLPCEAKRKCTMLSRVTERLALEWARCRSDASYSTGS